MRGFGVQFGRGAGPVFEAVASEQKGILPWGRDHHRAFRKLNGHRMHFSAICEDLPEEHNRVTLDPVLKDGHGIPAPKIDYRLSENSQAMMDHALARGREFLEAAGATDICTNSPNSLMAAGICSAPRGWAPIPNAPSSTNGAARTT